MRDSALDFAALPPVAGCGPFPTRIGKDGSVPLRVSRRQGRPVPLVSLGRDTARAMSRENVDLVRGLIPPSDADLAALFRDKAVFDQMVSALEPFIDPQVESVAVWQGGTVYNGVEGFRQLWLDWLEPWTSYHTAVDEAIDGGDRVLLFAHDTGRRQDADAEVELFAASIWDVRDGKIVRVEFFGSRAEALEAAGLRE
jgi:ketosteroid isomerase-like protein